MFSAPRMCFVGANVLQTVDIADAGDGSSTCNAIYLLHMRRSRGRHASGSYAELQSATPERRLHRRSNNSNNNPRVGRRRRGGEGVTIIIIVIVIVVLALAGACIGVMRASRKDNGTKVAPAEAGAAAALTATETANEAALAQHQDVAEVVATGMGLVNSLLTAGSLVPFVGNIAEVANEYFGSASEFADKADDVVTAALRVVEVLELLTLMNKNADREGQGDRGGADAATAGATASFHAAVGLRRRGWLKNVDDPRTCHLVGGVGSAISSCSSRCFATRRGCH